MDTDFRLIRTRSTIAVFSWIGAVYLVLLGLVNLTQLKFLIASFDIGIALTLIFNNLFFIKTNRIKHAGTLILAVLLLFFTYILYEGGLYNAGLLWQFIYPVAAFLLKGKREGAVWSAALFFSDLFLVAGTLIFNYAVPFSFYYLLMFFMVYVFISGFIYSYERLRELSENTVIRNNNKLEKLNRELTYLSEYDTLTNVFNRRKILFMLQEELKRYKRYGTVFSILLFDIDNFKEINDSYGHQTGDQVLLALSDIIKNRYLREVDIFGRYGGDEFLIILPQTDIGGASWAAERLCETARSLKVHDKHTKHNVCATLSLGVAVIGKDKNIAALLHEADIALYKSKEGGRDRYTVFAQE